MALKMKPVLDAMKIPNPIHNCRALPHRSGARSISIIENLLLSALFLCFVTASQAHSGEFDPVKYGPVYLWFDAAHGVTGKEGKAASWQSRVGDAVVSQSVPQWQPNVTVQGPGKQPSLDFDYGAFLSGNANGDFTEQKTTVLVMAVPDRGQGSMGALFSFGASGYQLPLQTPTPQTLHFPFLWGPVEKKYGRDALAASGIKGSTIPIYKGPLADLSILTTVYGAEETAIYLNGKEIAKFDKGLGSPCPKECLLTIGAASEKGQQCLTGYISELIFFEEPLTSEKRAEMEKELAQKYQITLP
jgi:hypothetical protein